MHPYSEPIAANRVTEMISPVVDLVPEGQIRLLLHQNQSAREIIDEIRETTGQVLSRFKIYKVKKRTKQESGVNGKKEKKPKKMTQGKVTKLLSMADKSDPPTQRKMAVKLGVHHSTIQKYFEKWPKVLKKIIDNNGGHI